MKMSKYFLLSALTVTAALNFGVANARASSSMGDSHGKMRDGHHISIGWMDDHKLQMLNGKLDRLVIAQEKNEEMIKKVRAHIRALQEKYQKSTPDQKKAMKEKMKMKLQAAKMRLENLLERLGVVKDKKEWVEAYLVAKKSLDKNRTEPAKPFELEEIDFGSVSDLE